MTGIVTGNAHYRISAKGVSRLVIGSILLANMNAVAAGLNRQIGSIVHDDRHTPGLRHRAQDIGRAADFVVVDILETDLQAGHVAGVDRRREIFGESGGIDFWRSY